MKKVVKFEFFEPGQYLFFDIMRLAQLEESFGESLIKIIEKGGEGNLGINFELKALSVGLKHHYPQNTEQVIADKMTTFFENGGTVIALIPPIFDALGGIWKTAKDKDTDEKNAEKAQKPKSKA